MQDQIVLRVVAQAGYKSFITTLVRSRFTEQIRNMMV